MKGCVQFTTEPFVIHIHAIKLHTYYLRAVHAI
jgi:hypothetical protein